MKRRLAETASRSDAIASNRDPQQRYLIPEIANDAADSLVRTSHRGAAIIATDCRYHHGRKVMIIVVLLLGSFVYAVFWVLTTTSTTDMSVQQETFSVADSARGLPPQCQSILTRLNTCQTSKPFSAGVVIACHQTWCNRWGHCELCSGIGDRTRFLMSLIQDALDRCIPFQIDSPQTGLAMREDVVYRDRLGILADWFHYRSYDVTDHRVSVNEWSDNNHNHNNHSANVQTKPIFVHMTPNDYATKIYDPCLFHILFRPSRVVKRQLDSYMSKMTAQRKNLIGIHFRSGDLPAFGLTEYKDARVTTNNMELALEKMMKCSQILAKRLFPDSMGNPAFFFATDHRDAKELVKRKYSSRNMTIYTTDIIPQSYRMRDQDVQAWLEVWILSNMKGLVMNVLPKEYIGTAGYVSFFSVLAANIGFMNKTQIYPC